MLIIYRTVLITLLFSLFSAGVQGQFGFEFDNSIIVKNGNDTLTNAWGGGLNYTQVSDFDFDYDGDMDLLLFDRSNNNLRVYSQENSGNGPHYQVVYNAKQYFPSEIRYRATMVDYNNDGKKDLWIYNLSGLRVYKNVGDATNGLQWELAKDLVYTEYVTGVNQLFVNASDIPAIVDVDNDGDIDVLTFHSGGSNVEYHQNQSMELYGIPDSLIYEVKNECWGLFSEDFNTNVINLNETNFPCTGSAIANPLRTANEGDSNDKKKHAGSTLLALDLDNSGVLDLILGDVSFTTMTMLMNGGSTVNSNSPMISQDNNYPSSSTPIDMYLFPAAFFVDVDFDGVKDLVVGANARNISENESSLRFYKNIGTNSLPNFIHSADNVLQNEMIEHGTGSVPVLFDYNEDGLKDLFVANIFRYIPTNNKESTIAMYLNTGTATSPEFTYIDYNFLNLDQQNYGLKSTPTFGDIDNDGDEDLFIGIENGTLVYYENQSVGTGAVFTSGLVNYQDNNGQPISCNGYAHPQLFDLDNDGLLDLLIGSLTGEIVYYKNIGSPTNPSFALENSQLGNIDLSDISFPNAHVAPHFFRLNGVTKLFTGSFKGKLVYYDSLDNHLGTGQSFNLVSNNYIGIDVEAYSSFFVDDIDNDGELNLFVGQDLGGVYHFEANPNSDLSLNDIQLKTQVVLYPNPIKNVFTVRSSLGALQLISVFNHTGQLVIEKQTNALQQNISMQSMGQGIYTVKIVLENGSIVTKKVVKY
jgi:hypothetical protein